MNSRILPAIINITRQREADSLDLSLVTALADIVPVNEISILKTLKENTTDKVEEVVRLSVSANSPDKNNFILDNNKKTITANNQIIECIRSTTTIRQTLDGSIYLYFPFLMENEVTGVLKIKSHKDISEWQSLIEGIICVYCNYLTVFNESEHDKLTGLLNRRTFDYKLEKLLRTQRKYQEKYAASNQGSENRHANPKLNAWLAMLDIDHFKRINDTYGHLFGDEVILLISQKLKQFFRSSDLLFRFGGEEFVIILEPIPVAMAYNTFERFRKTIASHMFPQIGKTTVSIGYAMITENDHSHVILERADKALYHAKEHGRDCVYNYETLLESGQAEEKRKAGSTIFFDSNTGN
jgi:diguanylate cyclase (GGDEF)-like protein